MAAPATSGFINTGNHMAKTPSLIFSVVICFSMACAAFAERPDDPNPESVYSRHVQRGGNAAFRNNSNPQGSFATQGDYPSQANYPSRQSTFGQTPPRNPAKQFDEKAYYSAPSNPAFIDRWGLSQNFPLKLPTGGTDYQLFAFPSDKEIEVYQRKIGSNVPRTGNDYNENDFFRDHAPGARRRSRGAHIRPK